MKVILTVEGAVRCGGTVGAVVPGGRPRRRRAPHEHGLPHRLVPVDVRLDVLDLRGEHPVVVGTGRRAASRVRRRGGRLQGVPAARAGHHHRGRLVLLLLLEARDRAAVTTRDRSSRVRVVVLGRVGLARQLLVAFVSWGQGHVDEAVVARRRGVVLRVVRPQRPVLE